MPIQIGKKQTAQDPADTLIECHGRIRNFCSVAVTLARSAHAPAAEIVEAAKQLHRYFTISLPRHSADEDDSIAPRLRKSNAYPELLQMLDGMATQHKEIDHVLERLIPRWSELTTAPDRLGAHAAELARDSAELKALFDIHLDEEERVLIPAMRTLLDKQAEQEIMAEWRARRDL